MILKCKSDHFTLKFKPSGGLHCTKNKLRNSRQCLCRLRVPAASRVSLLPLACSCCLADVSSVLPGPQTVSCSWRSWACPHLPSLCLLFPRPGALHSLTLLVSYRNMMPLLSFSLTTLFKTAHSRTNMFMYVPISI